MTSLLLGLLAISRPVFIVRQGTPGFGPPGTKAVVLAPFDPSVVGAAGGRTVNAPRINIELTILPEKVEDYLHFLESVWLSAGFQPCASPRQALVVSGRR